MLEDGLSKHADPQGFANGAVASVRADEILSADLNRTPAGAMNERRQHMVVALLKGGELGAETDLSRITSLSMFKKHRLEHILVGGAAPRRAPVPLRIRYDRLDGPAEKLFTGEAA